jgi:hypothetical protein
MCGGKQMMNLRNKILNDINKLNYTYDCRKSKTAKPGLLDLCEVIEKRLGNSIELVEIGTFSGISSFIFSYYFKKVFTIDPYIAGYDAADLASDPSKIDLKKVEQEFIKKTMKARTNINKVKMLSEDAVRIFDDGSLDVVYLDGNHSKSGIALDIELFLPKVKIGGILAGHDYGTKHHKGVTEVVDSYFKDELIRFPDSSWMVQL